MFNVFYIYICINLVSLSFSNMAVNKDGKSLCFISGMAIFLGLFIFGLYVITCVVAQVWKVWEGVRR